jgi:xyloglucan-specific exo-beta-1,4-glucanase
MNLKSIIGIVAILSVSLFAQEPYSWGNVRMDGGGFVSAVIAHPNQEGLFYARTDVGGVYRFDSQAQKWIPLMDFVSQEDVGLYGTESFAIDPKNPGRLYVMGGTSYFSQGKTAILRSEDYGATFEVVDVSSLWKAHGNGMGRQTGEKLAVDPKKSEIVLCGTRRDGLFKSTDAGKTWQKISSIGEASGADLLNQNGISFVFFDSTSAATTSGATSVIYMGVSATTSNLYKSTDGGSTWNPVSGGPASMMPHRVTMLNGNLYITFSNNTGPHNITQGAFYKYNTASGVWTNLTPKEGDSYLGSGGQSYAHGFGGVSIDPADENHILISTLNYYGGQSRYATGEQGWGDRIYVTKDGGQTWKTTFTYAETANAATANVGVKDNNWIAGHAIHWAGCITFNPFNTNEAWVTSGNGVFRSQNVNAEKPIWNFESRGIEETVPLDIVSVPGGPLVTAIGDYDGSSFTDIFKSTPVHSPSIGTTHSLGYAPLNGSFLRVGRVTDYSTGTGIDYNKMYFSEDNAKTWTETPEPKGAHGFVALSADAASWLHRLDNSDMVYYSLDKGTTWSAVTGLDAQAQYAKIVPDPVNPNVFYVLDQQGKLKKSTDQGKTFAVVGSVQNDAQGLYQASNGYIRTVPNREGHIWAPLDQEQSWAANGKFSTNGLALSEDGGATWQRFPSVYAALAVGIGKAAPEASYETIFIWGVAGSSTNPLGIYRSTDKGASWVRINDDMHQYGGPGNGAFVQGDMNVFGRVYMSTVGRGLVYGEIAGTTSAPKVKIQQQRPSATLSYHQLRLHVETSVPAQLQLFNLQGKLLYTQAISSSAEVSLQPWKGKGILVAQLVSKQGRRLSFQKINCN